MKNLIENKVESKLAFRRWGASKILPAPGVGVLIPELIIYN